MPNSPSSESETGTTQMPTRVPVPAAAPLRRRIWSGIRKEPAGTIGLATIVLLVLIALAAPLLPLDPFASDSGARFLGPTREHPLGTDPFGRDTLARLIFGMRTSLSVGFGAAALGVLVGVTVGVLGGYRGGAVDFSLQRAIDVFMAFPMLLLALALAAVFGPSVRNVTLALALPIIPNAARVSRATVLEIKGSGLLEPSRSFGTPWTRIVRRYLWPNVTPAMIVIFTAYVGLAIRMEAALSWLGVGIREPNPSWGLMMSGPALETARSAPLMIIAPGSLIVITVLAINFGGDSLRNWLDPVARRSS
jgi:peptide/nickel transport system permease protein